jgi:hypothetical protein
MSVAGTEPTSIVQANEQEVPDCLWLWRKRSQKPGVRRAKAARVLRLLSSDYSGRRHSESASAESAESPRLSRFSLFRFSAPRSSKTGLRRSGVHIRDGRFTAKRPHGAIGERRYAGGSALEYG